MRRLEFSRQLSAPVSFKGIWPPGISTQQVWEAKHVAAGGKQQITFDQGPEEKHDSLQVEEATSELSFITPWPWTWRHWSIISLIKLLDLFIYIDPIRSVRFAITWNDLYFSSCYDLGRSFIMVTGCLDSDFGPRAPGVAVTLWWRPPFFAS